MGLDIFMHSSAWVSLLTLCLLEIVLGIDNLVFISMAVSRLPREHQAKARFLGLSLALLMRLLLLSGAAWLISFNQTILTIHDQPVSVRDLFLLMGGLFLLIKATNEIHLGLHDSVEKPRNPLFRRFAYVILQIIMLDMVFSFDSIMTAIGLTSSFLIMAIAIISSIVLMMFASGPLGHFINKYPSLRLLALTFLMLIGMVLLADGLHFEIPRGYVYFAMLFSLVVEVLNILAGRRRDPVANADHTHS